MQRKIQIFSAGTISFFLSIALLASFPTLGFSADQFGAIACTRNCKKWAAANNYPTQAEAEAKAVVDCQQKHGESCKSVMWFRNACGALAISSNSAWASDWGNSEEEARQKVLNACLEFEGQDCTIGYLECTEW